jgi:hypothetical protein
MNGILLRTTTLAVGLLASGVWLGSALAAEDKAMSDGTMGTTPMAEKSEKTPSGMSMSGHQTMGRETGGMPSDPQQSAERSMGQKEHDGTSSATQPAGEAMGKHQ